MSKFITCFIYKSTFYIYKIEESLLILDYSQLQIIVNWQITIHIYSKIYMYFIFLYITTRDIKSLNKMKVRNFFASVIINIVNTTVIDTIKKNFRHLERFLTISNLQNIKFFETWNLLFTLTFKSLLTWTMFLLYT